MTTLKEQLKSAIEAGIGMDYEERICYADNAIESCEKICGEFAIKFSNYREKNGWVLSIKDGSYYNPEKRKQMTQQELLTKFKEEK